MSPGGGPLLLSHPACALHRAPGHPEREVHAFDDELDTEQGWAKYNSHFWARNYPEFLEFFFAQCLTEPHSTKQIEDCIGWALETVPSKRPDPQQLSEVERAHVWAPPDAMAVTPVKVSPRGITVGHW